MEEELEHFSHKHPLILHTEKQENQNRRCDGCDGTISTGPFYSCEVCDFDLHKSCTDLPFEISNHPFHKGHPLFLSYWPQTWKCNKCNDTTSPGFKYSCYKCEYTLDLRCAFFASPYSLTTHEQDITTSHFLHDESHPLIVKDMRDSIESLKQTTKCSFCNLNFCDDSVGYFCVSCVFYIHKTCADQVTHEPVGNAGFHPDHPLHQTLIGSDVTCSACKIRFKGLGYSCKSCFVYFHVQCAKLKLLSLKHKRHKKHELFYFINKVDFDADVDAAAKPHFVCDVCYFDCEGSFYRCVVCDFNVHFECIPLPLSVKVYKDHKHGLLALVEGNAVSGVENYTCCKKPRNPEHKLYYCEDCGYGADINCVMNEEGKSLKVGSYMGSKEDENGKMQHFSHKHPLLLHLESRDCYGDVLCNGCNDFIITGPYYSCGVCNFNLHKACTELPFEISHRFHKKHSLFLSYWPKTWKCNKCKEQSIPGFKYSCYKCEYTLDFKCAFSPFSTPQQQRTAIVQHHEIHDDHALILAEYVENPMSRCSSCHLSMSGTSSKFFCCVYCAFFLHKYCADYIKSNSTIRKREFHPDHDLTALNIDEYVECAACRIKFKGIAYCCLPCKFYLHVRCSKLKFITFKHKCHAKHNLYFITNYPKQKRLFCNACYCRCEESFYRCVICNFNIHFECIPLPQTVLKYKHHKHGPLNYVDGHIEPDGSGFYYCASCELSRNPDLGIYFCEDCPFEVDIGCLMEEEEKSLVVESYMVPKNDSSLVQHFSHKHPLITIERGEEGQGRSCSGCTKTVTGPAYCCRICDFNLHKSCFEMPFQISHPYHNKHPLFLSYWDGTWKCKSNKCRTYDQNVGFAYYCYRCEFTLGLQCATRVPEQDDEEEKQESFESYFSKLEEEIRQRDTTIAERDETIRLLTLELDHIKQELDETKQELDAIRMLNRNATI